MRQIYQRYVFVEVNNSKLGDRIATKVILGFYPINFPGLTNVPYILSSAPDQPKKNRP